MLHECLVNDAFHRLHENKNEQNRRVCALMLYVKTNKHNVSCVSVKKINENVLTSKVIIGKVGHLCMKSHYILRVSESVFDLTLFRRSKFAESPSVNQVLWSANFYYLASL